MSLEELKTNISKMPDLDIHSHLIPAITMVGKETGLPVEGTLVPQVSDSLAKDSSMGILPMILAHGGNTVQVPATSAMKQELFSLIYGWWSNLSSLRTSLSGTQSSLRPPGLLSPQLQVLGGESKESQVFSQNRIGWALTKILL